MYVVRVSATIDVTHALAMPGNAHEIIVDFRGRRGREFVVTNTESEGPAGCRAVFIRLKESRVEMTVVKAFGCCIGRGSGRRTRECGRS